MAGPEGQEPPPKTQVEFSGTGGGPGAKKPTAVGTGDDGDWDWLSRMNFLTSLTTEASEELEQLLSSIARKPGVICVLIVGHDGRLIASVAPPGFDAESVGVWALGVFMNTEHVIRKLGQEVHQIVSLTTKGYVTIADFGGGLLVMVSDRHDLHSQTVLPSGGGLTV